MRRFAPFVACCAAVLVGLYAVRHGTYTAGASDSYGYVDQAYRWWHRELPAPIPIPLGLPLPFSDLLQIPLGYGPGPAPHTMVPTYAPGLPLIMAASLVFGPCGPFAIVPLLAAVLVLATYWLGLRVADPATGLIAALLIAISPTVLFQSTWPMTDVPAGAIWTLALAASLGRTRLSSAAAGALTALGLLVRPNLLPVVVVPFGCTLALSGTARERLQRAMLFAAPVALVSVIVASINLEWYGSPLKSGYGSLGDLYAFHNIWPNLLRYPAWLWRSQSPIVVIALLPLLPRPSSHPARRAAIPLAAMSIVVLLCYISYLPWEDWWYLRFLLPGAGAFAVLMALGLGVLSRSVRPPVGPALAVLAFACAVVYTIAFSWTSHLLPGGLSGERRYIAAGRYVRALAPDSVVFAFLHSGSARFYGGRQTLRYEYIARRPEDAARALEAVGFHPYLLIDDGEAPDVRRHFKLADGPLPWPLVAHLDEFNGVSLYDMGTSATPRRTERISADTDSVCRAPVPVAIAPRR